MTEALIERLDPRHYAEVARLVLPAPIAGWVESGSGPPSDNEAAFRRRRLLPHALADVRDVSIGTTLLGRSVSMPVGVAPVAMQRALHPEGEGATARAAERSGVVCILAVNATTPVVEVAAAAPGAELWLQVASWADRDALATLVGEAEGAGVRAIVPLVNSPVPVAHVPASLGFRLPAGLEFANGAAAQAIDAGLDESHLRWLVELTSLPIVAKGVLRPDDARRIVDAGVAGVIVSNHGNRQLPRSVATIDALEAVAGAVGDRVEVYLDGGVRSGSDVLVALALGARAVFLGRPFCWGLAVGGEDGVARVLEAFRAELASDAALCGVTDLADVPRDLVVGASA